MLSRLVVDPALLALVSMWPTLTLIQGRTALRRHTRSQAGIDAGGTRGVMRAGILRLRSDG